jgi:hypothetical protein
MKTTKFEEKVTVCTDKNASKRIVTYFALPSKYAGIDFNPPVGARESAKRALEERDKKPASQRGMTPVGIARARDLANGRTLSPDTVRRMLSYFQRHEVDKQGLTWSDWGKGRQAWEAWGGDAGYSWAKKIVKAMDQADDIEEQQTILSEDLKNNSKSAYNEDMQEIPLQETVLMPETIEYTEDGHIVGKPFLALSVGKNFSRFTGKQVGAEVTPQILSEILRVFSLRKELDPVILDWEHSSSRLVNPEAPDPSVGKAFGRVVDLKLEEDGTKLYVYPEYTEAGAKLVKESQGNLYASPEFTNSDVFARESGEKVGSAQLLAVTLTPRPAQSQSRIEPIMLNENITLLQEISSMELDPEKLKQMSPEELAAMCMEKHQMVLQLEAEKEALKSEMDAYKAEMEAKMQADAAEPGEPMDSPMALSERILNDMKGQVNALSEQVKVLTKEKQDAHRKLAIDSLLNTGKIAPNEVQTAEKAYDFKDTQPAFWSFFSERKANASVPLQVVGHAQTGAEVTLLSEVQAIKTKEGISFSEALDKYRKQNPTQYSKFYGV